MPPTRPELFELYKIAIDVYRFEVNLNNDRIFRYLVFNAAVLSVAATLLKSGGDPAAQIFVALVFLAGAVTARLGVRAVTKGHEYYRRAAYKNTLIEAALGLHRPPIDALDVLGANMRYPGATLAIATTAGQAEVERILQSPEEWISRPLRSGTIMKAGATALWWLFAANVFGLVAALIFAGLNLLHRFFPGIPVL